MAKLKYDETGKVYGRLMVVCHVGSGQWNCLCQCGNSKVISGGSLRSGDTTSCGCYHSEVCRERLSSHGMSGSPVLNSYSQAKKRCSNKNDKGYHRYGGRGIKFLLPEFSVFWEQMKDSWFEGATLGRKDNDGHYEMSNVRWETRTQQNENKSSNVVIRYGGVTMILRDWLKLLGISRHMYSNHVKKGLSFENMIDYYKSNAYTKRRERGCAGEKFDLSSLKN